MQHLYFTRFFLMFTLSVSTLVKASEVVTEEKVLLVNEYIGQIDGLILQRKVKETGYEDVHSQILNHKFTRINKKEKLVLIPFVIKYSFKKPFNSSIEKSLKKILQNGESLTENCNFNFHNVKMYKDIYRGKKYKMLSNCTYAKSVTPAINNILTETLFFNRKALLFALEQLKPSTTNPTDIPISPDQE